MKKFVFLFLLILFSSPAFSSDLNSQATTEQIAEDVILPDVDSAPATGPVLLQLNQQRTAPEIQCIVNSGVIRVAIYSGDAPPFFMRDKNGNRIGIDVRIAEDLANELGVKTEFIDSPTFDDVVLSVRDGKADVGISKLSVTLKRARMVRYAGRYVEMGKAMLMNRLLFEKLKTSRDTTVRELFEKEGASIGVIANSSYQGFAERIFPNTKLKTYEDWDAVIEAVLTGEVLGAFRDEWEIRKFMADNANAPLQTQAVIIDGEVDPIEMIVPWTSTHLAHFIDKFVDLKNYNFDVNDLFKEYKTYKELLEDKPKQE